MFLFPVPKQPTKCRTTTTSSSSPILPRLLLYPLHEKLPIRQLPRIGDPGRRLAPPGVKGQQRRDRGDHVSDGEGLGIWGVELDGDVVDPAETAASGGGGGRRGG